MDVRLPPVSRIMLSRTSGRLSPLLLVPLMSRFSSAVNGGVTSSRAFAAALQAAGRERLSGLQAAAPRVRAVLDKLNARLPHIHLNVEEIAIVRAVIEYYIGLVLQLLNRDSRERRSRRKARLFIRRRDVTPHYLFIPMSRSHRTRIGVLLPPNLG